MDDVHAEMTRLRTIAVSPDATVDEKVLALTARMDLITEQLEAVLDVLGEPHGRTSSATG